MGLSFLKAALREPLKQDNVPLVPHQPTIGATIPRGRRIGRARVAAGPPPANSVTPNPSGSRLYLVRFRDLWEFVKRQPLSFKLVCAYLFMEYVRPQQIYEAIAGPPYSKFIIGFAVIAFLFEGRSFRIRSPELLLGLFTAVLVASSVFALDPDASYAQFSLFFSWIVIYLLIANTVDTEERFLVFVLSFILYSFKMAQFGTRSWASAGFHFRDWGINGAPGWFSNSGEFGIQMCVFLPIAFYFTRALSRHWPRWKKYLFWSMPACALLSIVGSSSRGALVGLAAVAAWMVSKTRYKVRGLVSMAVVAAVVYWLLPPEQLARLQDSGTDYTSVTRTTMWKRGLELMHQYPFLGIGYKNWSPYMKNLYGQPLLPHNIFIEAGSELGYTGLFAFVVLIFATFVLNYRTRRLARQLPGGNPFLFEMAHGLDAALIGYLASGFFVTVLYYPFFWINFAMTVALHRAALNKVRGPGVPEASRLRRPRGQRNWRGAPRLPAPGAPAR
jgi:O-antigen ligase